jgi:hypothetical protein
VTEQPLVAHRASTAQPAVRAVAAAVERAGAGVRFVYRLTGDVAALAIPPRDEPRRADRLWEHTCFEAFVASGAGPSYYELNFSPSAQWAAYAFDGYRDGMRPLDLARPPSIVVAESAGELRVTAAVEFAPGADAPWPWRIGLSAVVEDRAGVRGYYALRHPRDTPDFHDAAGFAVLLDGSAR